MKQTLIKWIKAQCNGHKKKVQDTVKPTPKIWKTAEPDEKLPFNSWSNYIHNKKL